MQPSDLDADLMQQTLNDLRSGLSEGVGKSFLNYENNAVRNVSLNQHLYRFSGAKTYQQIALLNFYLKDKPSFADFKKEALKINDQYNKRYLETEFNTAKRSGEQATKWLKYQEQKELYPNLKYKTANDSRVREKHKNQKDIIKPIDDEFWLTWYPPNDFGCRCYVVQTDEKATNGTPKENPSPGFNNNVGVSNMIFAEDEHPYFVFPATDAKKIKESFENLKISTPDYKPTFETKKAKLYVSTWADPDGFEKNNKYAKILVENQAVDVYIRNHTSIDGIKNPEYKIKNLFSDLKVIDSAKRGVSNSFVSMREKMEKIKTDYSIVIALDEVNDITFEEIVEQLENKVSPNRGKRVQSVFFIKGDKSVELTRETMLKRDFEALKEVL
jgi:hypothetical protein